MVPFLLVTLQRKAGMEWPVVLELERDDALPVRREGVLRDDGGWRTRLLEEATPEGYGRCLGEALFQGEVRDAFVQACAAYPDRLRVLLFIEAEELQSLHWERLHVPVAGGVVPLGLAQRTPFSRYVPSFSDRPFPPLGRESLRALLLVASPAGLEDYGLAPLDVPAVAARLKQALGKDVPCDVLADVPGAVGAPTLAALVSRLTSTRYGLLHVVCHGRQADSGHFLYLADEGGRVVPTRATDLVARLGLLGGPRSLPHLVFLGVCESATPQASSVMGSLAHQLVGRLGLPAVVAMTEQVSEETVHALAEGFYPRLLEHGEVDLALAEAAVPLAQQTDITVPVLCTRLRGRPLLSASQGVPLTPSRIRQGLAAARQLLAERAPVLLAGPPAPGLPSFDSLARELETLAGGDLSGAQAQQRLQQLVEQADTLLETPLGLGFQGLCAGRAPPPYDARCPFRGLLPFQAGDARFFFGREAQVDALLRRWDAHPVLAMQGASGSGKSSLLQAGLLPALLQREPRLRWALFTPNADPVAELEARLAGPEGPPSLLIVDQFEELFTLCRRADQREVFVRKLFEVPGRRVLLSMRADFLADCLLMPELAQRIQDHQYLLTPLGARELRSAVEQQASQVGLHFEADLVHTLIEEVEGEPGAMPLLQHALLELWERRHGHWLLTREYRALGGVAQSVARPAERIHEALPPAEQRLMRETFLRLTRRDEEASGQEERRDTRRRVSLDSLVPAGMEYESVHGLVKRLADARLLVTSRSELTGQVQVEPGHEALLRSWKRLRTWLEEDLELLELREGLSDAAGDWERQREESLLVHRGQRLRRAEVARSEGRLMLNALEGEYLLACAALREQEHEQERARLNLRRRLLAVTGSVLVGAVAYYFWANSQLQDSEVRLKTELAQAFFYRSQVEEESRSQGWRGLLYAARAFQEAPEEDPRREVYRLRALHESLRVPRLEGQLPIACSAVSIDRSGQRMACTQSDRTVVVLFREASGFEQRPLEAWPEDILEGPLLSPDGRKVAALGRTEAADGGPREWQLRLWDAETGKTAALIELGPEDAVPPPEGRKHLYFLPSSAAVLVERYSEGASRLDGYDVASGRALDAPLLSTPFLSGTYALADFSPNPDRPWKARSRRVSAGPSAPASHQLEVIDWRTGQVLPGWHSDIQPGIVLSAAFDPSGERLAVSSYDGTSRHYDLRVLDAATGAQKHASRTPKSRGSISWMDPFFPRIVTLSRSGHRVLTSSSSFVLLVHGKEGDGPRLAALQEVEEFELVLTDSDLERVITRSSGHEFRVWDASTGQLLDEPWRPAFQVRDSQLIRTEQGLGMRVVAFDGRIFTQRVPAPSETRQLRLALRTSSVSQFQWEGEERALVVGKKPAVQTGSDSSEGPVLRAELHALDGGAALWSAGLTLHAAANQGVRLSSSPEAGELATLSVLPPQGQQVLQRWDLKTGAKRAEPVAVQGKVAELVYDAQGARWAWGVTGEVQSQLWHLDATTPPGVPRKRELSGAFVGFCGDRRHYMLQRGYELHVFSMKTHEPIHAKPLSFRTGLGAPIQLAVLLLQRARRIHQDSGPGLVLELPAARLRLRSTDEGARIENLTRKTSFVAPAYLLGLEDGSLEVSPDGRFLATAVSPAWLKKDSNEKDLNYVRVLDSATALPVGDFWHPRPVVAYRFTEEGPALQTVTSDGVVRSWWLGGARSSDAWVGSLGEALTGARLEADGSLSMISDGELQKLRADFFSELEAAAKAGDEGARRVLQRARP